MKLIAQRLSDLGLVKAKITTADMNAILERAAKVCEDMADEALGNGYTAACEECADAIRSLKDSRK
jgi:phage tail tape-measure protein